MTLIRRRGMLSSVPKLQPTTQTISWSGTGADQTSSEIDGSLQDTYFTLPFVAGDSALAASATAQSQGIKISYASLYDKDTGDWIGYYRLDTGTIVQSRPTTANRPWLMFNTEYRFAPKGYKVKLILSRSGSAAFSSNANMRAYINRNGTEVILK